MQQTRTTKLLSTRTPGGHRWSQQAKPSAAGNVDSSPTNSQSPGGQLDLRTASCSSDSQADLQYSTASAVHDHRKIVDIVDAVPRRQRDGRNTADRVRYEGLLMNLTIFFVLIWAQKK